jgi:hypothetical protein
LLFGKSASTSPSRGSSFCERGLIAGVKGTARIPF